MRQQSSIHTTQRSSYFLLVVNPGVSWYGVYLMMAHALLQKRWFHGSALFLNLCCVQYGTLHTRKKKLMEFTHAQLLSKQKGLESSLGKKSKYCPDSIQTVHKNTNREFRDKIVVNHWIKSPVKWSSVQNNCFGNLYCAWTCLKERETAFFNN